MQDYRQMYEDKKSTPKEMAKYVKSGDWVASIAALGEAVTVVNEICDRAVEEDLRDIKFMKTWMIPMGGRYSDPDLEGHVTPVSIFHGNQDVRQMVKTGKADYFPCHLSQHPDIWREVRPRIATALVSPMDENGYFSFSTNCLEGRTLAEVSEVFLLEVSPNVPRIHGDAFIHISEVTAFCETDRSIPTVPLSEPSEDDIKIAGYVAERVPDGACMQFGVGKVPDAVAPMLQDKKHLGIHTEMFGTAMYGLIESGAVDNSMKNIDKGKTVFTFCGGTQEVYDYLNDNPMVAGMRVDYVNNPYVIAQNDNVVSINSCLEVDLAGQVCAESMGPVQYSGTGGQHDFVKGAGMSKGGQSFICVHSTAKGGTISSIKPMLTEGAHVSTPMNDVDMVVTEFGLAELKFRSASERAKGLISIAHPDYRDELTFHARKIGLMI